MKQSGKQPAQPQFRLGQIFQSNSDKGMGPFIYETGRPHMSEATLLAGTNPELEAAEAAQQRRGQKKKTGVEQRGPMISDL